MVNIFQVAMTKIMRGRIKQKDLAIQVGISIPYINDLIRGRKVGQESVRRHIARALGYTDYEAFLDIGRRELGEATLRHVNSSPETKFSSDCDEFFRVPYSDHMSLNPECGRSIAIVKDKDSSPVMVHGPSLGLHEATNLQALRVTSDHMDPLIRVGGIVVVDVSQNKIFTLEDRNIYVVCKDTKHGVCTTQRLTWVEKGRSLAIESDNLARHTIYCHPDEVLLIGRVVWSGCAHV